MISYTIDPSVFIPPKIPNNNKMELNYRKDLKKYLNIINKCYEFIHIEGISVYVFRHCKNLFNEEYKIKANKSGFPVDIFKTRLDNILLLNMPKVHYGNKIGVKKYYFENWFEIEKINYSESSHKPNFDIQSENSDINYRINLIGILNNYIYKNSKFHYLITKEKIDQVLLETKNIKFSINNSEISEENMNSEIKLKSINNDICSNKKEFKTIFDVYKYTQEHFKKYIIFGNDVETGIKTIRDSAGPPDRIFAYLETLKEFTCIKRENKVCLNDDKLLQSLGCICSYENEEQMKDEKVKSARMFDNGNNKKLLFNLHLKPNTFSIDTGNKKRTVRIYVNWDENQKKVIVGWIGEHLYIPSKNINLLAFHAL